MASSSVQSALSVSSEIVHSAVVSMDKFLESIKGLPDVRRHRARTICTEYSTLLSETLRLAGEAQIRISPPRYILYRISEISKSPDIVEDVSAALTKLFARLASNVDSSIDAIIQQITALIVEWQNFEKVVNDEMKECGVVLSEVKSNARALSATVVGTLLIGILLPVTGLVSLPVGAAAGAVGATTLVGLATGITGLASGISAVTGYRELIASVDAIIEILEKEVVDGTELRTKLTHVRSVAQEYLAQYRVAMITEDDIGDTYLMSMHTMTTGAVQLADKLLDEIKTLQDVVNAADDRLLSALKTFYAKEKPLTTANSSTVAYP